ncbi:hypothetical protein PROPEN_00298 [Proteus penneri ATCC 35198]|nr:hypothetical protein PROPEN_00298 [Proteus penneri ATCC 35198]
MLRSVHEKLLDYTCEGVLIRARYIRQLDNIHKINLATKNNAKKNLFAILRKNLNYIMMLWLGKAIAKD